MNRRRFLGSAIAAPWVITGAGVLMPLRRVWSRDFNFLHDVTWTREQTELYLRCAPMRIQTRTEGPGGWWTREVTLTTPEIYVRGSWMGLGRTDLLDDVATGFCANQSVEKWREYYLEKAVSGLGGRYHDWPHGEGFSVIDSYTDG